MHFKLSHTLALGLAAAALLVLSGTATSSTSPQRAAEAPESYYLALGDSMAYGFQPTKADRPPSQVDTGYVDVIAARLRKHAPNQRVVNYGCPGESTVTFANGGCDWLKGGGKLHDAFSGSQLEAAQSFLQAHPGQVSPITMTLWGGDLFPLSQNRRHARQAIAAFGSRFTAILKQLRAAAPNAEIVVSGAWDPEADRLAQTEPLYRSADAAIKRAAAASHVRVANMFPALDGTGSLKARQARLCRLTFYCSQNGDPHPTDAGYRVMADAFTATSKR